MIHGQVGGDVEIDYRYHRHLNNSDLIVNFNLYLEHTHPKSILFSHHLSKPEQTIILTIFRILLSKWYLRTMTECGTTEHNPDV